MGLKLFDLYYTLDSKRIYKNIPFQDIAMLHNTQQLSEKKWNDHSLTEHSIYYFYFFFCFFCLFLCAPACEAGRTAFFFFENFPLLSQRNKRTSYTVDPLQSLYIFCHLLSLFTYKYLIYFYFQRSAAQQNFTFITLCVIIPFYRNKQTKEVIIIANRRERSI